MGSRGAAEDLVPRQLLIDANETVARLRNQLDEAAVRGRYEPCKLSSAPRNRITGASKRFGTHHEQQAPLPAWVAGIDTGVHVGHVLGLHLIPSGLPLKFPGAAEQIHRVCVCLPQKSPLPAPACEQEGNGGSHAVHPVPDQDSPRTIQDNRGATSALIPPTPWFRMPSQSCHLLYKRPMLHYEGRLTHRLGALHALRHKAT